MTATELRIGNWVQFRHTETPVRITLGDFVREYKEEHLEDYEPIPLTEEWLLKFGFVKCDKPHYSRGDYYSLGDFYYWASYSGLVVNGYDPIDEVSIAVKHVHQLQNLYFALTSKELTQNK
jgi:hypothetical protein